MGVTVKAEKIIVTALESIETYALDKDKFS